MNTSLPESRGINLVGLVAGIIVFALFYLLFSPADLERPAQIVAAVGAMMAIWWATEAIPLPATALLPIIAFPLAGVMSIAEATAPYANPIIFLFLGGFLVALAVERSQLHRRIALAIFRLVGSSGKGLVAGFMLAAALLSMWISNTSTTLMLFPIAVSLALVVGETSPGLTQKAKHDFQIALLLGLAYGASIGGVATLVGTPTNAFMVGFLQSEYNLEIPFARWMIIGIPISLILLPLGWLMLTQFLFPISFASSQETRAELDRRHAELGTMSTAEKRTAILFLLLIAGWVLRKPISSSLGLEGLSDAGVAMTAALLAFLIPSGTDRHALVTWEDTKRLPWGVLILFGGGLSLAGALSSTGLTLWLGQQMAPLGVINPMLLVVALTSLVIFLTELTSNVATTATLLPVVAALAIELGVDPLMLVVPVTIAASCAFMLPVATPPNAIVFSSGEIQIREMMRAGLWLNIVSIALVSAVALWFVPAVL
ncbi:SLC13 family permease [Altererythrobacter ishigakiensis]|uniref:Sodium-dependent dicarboxylate transporter 2/3/5 n=1 Tax=Altererythrobacter ishigakiensis TaxID=476157 RepID=A0A562UM64_9SPHN|nr:DASS family sodium-coupled anion symporter [Altererythrobacter ishigakiensis]TWJ06704.1 sodium-dependent dicarboxylate transporter 2/3/5 [Altererythrobacter ishigakiensis]